MAAPKVYKHQVEGPLSTQAPRCYAQRSSNQNLPINTWTVIIYEGTAYDVGGMWNSSNPDEILIPMNGIYLATFTYGMGGTAGNPWDMQIGSTGSQVLSRTYQTGNFRTIDGASYGTLATTGYFKKGDTIYASVYSGGAGATYYNLTVDGLAVHYLGALAV